MIAFVIVSIALLGVLAVVVGIVDAAQSFKRREIAAERRERWESLHPGHEEIVPSPVSEF